MAGKDDAQEPLEAEQRNRDRWRGGETILDDDAAPGHTLPESERDRATSGTGQSRDPKAAPTPIPPPD
jgi:hypothetical protein